MINSQEQFISPPSRRVRVNFVLVMSTIVAALGGLLFGLDTAIIAGTTDSLTQLFHLSPVALGVTVSSALWGTILGASIAGWLGQRFGRRDSLRIMAALYVISAIGMQVNLYRVCKGVESLLFDMNGHISYLKRDLARSVEQRGKRACVMAHPHATGKERCDVGGIRVQQTATSTRRYCQSALH
jgi:Sugar (and other) transporter